MAVKENGEGVTAGDLVEAKNTLRRLLDDLWSALAPRDAELPIMRAQSFLENLPRKVEDPKYRDNLYDFLLSVINECQQLLGNMQTILASPDFLSAPESYIKATIRSNHIFLDMMTAESKETKEHGERAENTDT